uniref:Transposase n=1 Tax=Ascaris lumbricoides TaxID=6252 RepID=A0A0M3IL16_ASCLU
MSDRCQIPPLGIFEYGDAEHGKLLRKLSNVTLLVSLLQLVDYALDRTALNSTLF